MPVAAISLGASDVELKCPLPRLHPLYPLLPLTVLRALPALLAPHPSNKYST